MTLRIVAELWIVGGSYERVHMPAVPVTVAQGGSVGDLASST